MLLINYPLLFCFQNSEAEMDSWLTLVSFKSAEKKKKK